ncbi:MAG: hypothetical protein KGL39_38805, partial [Patescibacteria group bacterium]|nr:hypothetical protein [Patescibacteria group bacterium]
MSVATEQKTIKKIWRNEKNTKGFANFTPNWNLVFTDGTEAKINLEKYGHLKEKVAENGNYIFVLEDGVTDAGKPWSAVRDVLPGQA